MAVPALLAALGRGGAAAGGSGGAMAGMSKALQQTQGAANGAQQALGRTNQALHMVTGATGTMVRALAAGSDAIKTLAGPLAAFVGLRSPAAVKQFELAMRDMNAVIGQILLPVFNALTGAARMMGDTYATLADALQPLMTGIADAITTVFKEIGSVARENAGVIRMMAHFLAGVVNGFADMISVVVRLVSSFHPFMKLLREAADLLGLGGRPEERSARGMAIRNVSIGNSGGDLARKAQEAAFSAALNQGKKMQTPTESKLDTLIRIVADILKFLRENAPTKQQAAAAGGTAAKVLPGGGAFQGGRDLGRWLGSLLTR
jgi:hypothetical protein